MDMKVKSNWVRICLIDDIPVLGSRVVERNEADGGKDEGNIAIFRTGDDKVFALRDRCPHKGGPLSQGIVHGETVTCPLHGWHIGLDSGEAKAPDVGCAERFGCKIENGVVHLDLQ
jgi:nitrite reductase (NADH) small subunit